VFGDGDEDFSRHVTALFRARCLIFDVDTSGALLDKHFGELHDGGKTTMPSVSVGNNGTEVVDDWSRNELLR